MGGGVIVVGAMAMMVDEALAMQIEAGVDDVSPFHIPSAFADSPLCVSMH